MTKRFHNPVFASQKLVTEWGTIEANAEGVVSLSSADAIKFFSSSPGWKAWEPVADEPAKPEADPVVEAKPEPEKAESKAEPKTGRLKWQRSQK